MRWVLFCMVCTAFLSYCGKCRTIFTDVYYGNHNCVKAWLEKGGDPNLKTGEGRSLLYLSTGPKGNAGVTELLLQFKADPDIGHGSHTPLMNAASWVNLAECKKLIEYGADPLLKDEWGRTAKDLIGSAGGSEKKLFEYLYSVTSSRVSSELNKSDVKQLGIQ